MSVANIHHISEAPPSFLSGPRPRLWIGLAIGFVVLLIAGIVLLSANWPYGYRKILPMLEDDLGSQVNISNYHRIYFPSPGLIATGITMRRKSAPDLPPFGSADRLVIQGRWIDMLMLRKRMHPVDITNLHIVIRP